MYYKPPRVKDYEFEKVFVETCNLLQIESNHLLLIGDMNFNMVVENKLSELCRLYDLKSLVKGPMCYKDETPSAVDVIISNEPLRFQSSINVTCAISDFHNLTCVATKLQKSYSAPQRIYYRSYIRFNEDIFLNDLCHLPTSVCEVFDDIDDKVWCY